MPKNKAHKGLTKRVSVTASGKVKIGRAGGRHLKSHKPSNRVRKYRYPKYVCAAEAGRIGDMLNTHVRSQENHAAEKKAAKESASSSEE